MILITTKTDNILIDERNALTVDFDSKRKVALIRFMQPDGTFESIDYSDVQSVKYHPNDKPFTLMPSESATLPSTPRQDGVFVKNLYHLSNFFTARTLNVLKAHDVNTVEDLCKLTRADVKKFRYFRNSMLEEIDDFMQLFHLQFRESDEQAS